MTIYVFVIDNSASMAQSSYAGVNLLDFAKNFVSTFYAIKSKHEPKMDRFMAITCDEFPGCIKAGWNENAGVFLERVKRLQPVGTTSLETAVGRAFWFLNNNRLNNDIPCFGWNISRPEPAVVIILTDGALLGPQFIPEKIRNPSTDFFQEIYRPDQRAYGVVLRIPLKAPPTGAPLELNNGGLADFCSATGGKCYDATSARNINNAADLIHKKTIVNSFRMIFSYTGPELEVEAKNGTEEVNSRSDISSWKETFTGVVKVVKTNNWPIPESYFGDASTTQIPQRPACPRVCFTFDPKPPPVIFDGNLFDRYELEPSPLTSFILERNIGHYPIYVKGSGKKNRDFFCGFLVAENIKSKPEEKLPPNAVVLYVVAFNYQFLYPILRENQQRYGSKEPIPSALRQKLVEYIHHVPVYYFVTFDNKYNTLKSCFRSLNLPDEDFNRITYSTRIFNTIATWRANIRREYDLASKAVNEHSDKHNDDIPRTKVHVETILQKAGPNASEYTGDGALAFILEHKRPKFNPSLIFVSAKHISRKELIPSLTKLRVNYNLYGRDLELHVFEGGLPGQKIKLHQAEECHNRPIKAMGEYESYTRRLNEIGFTPLREVDPPATTSHAFGNPFKLDKKVHVDEVGEETSSDASRSSSPNPSESGKRGRLVQTRIDLSAFTRLRKRSGTFSETSSIASTPRALSPVSDVGYDSSTEMNGFDKNHKADIVSPNGYEKAASPSPSVINGLMELNIHKRALSFDDDDGSSSECSSPAPKKMRGLSGTLKLSDGLDGRKLNEYKLKAQNIAHANPTPRPADTLTQLLELIHDLAVKDQISILLHAELKLLHMKRNAHCSAVKVYRQKLQSGK